MNTVVYVALCAIFQSMNGEEISRASLIHRDIQVDGKLALLHAGGATHLCLLCVFFQHKDAASDHVSRDATRGASSEL